MPFLMLIIIIALLFGCFTVVHLTKKLADYISEQSRRKQSNFEELLVKYISVSIHQRNIYQIAIEMHMVANGMSPNMTGEIFQLRQNNHYHLRNISQFMKKKNNLQCL